MVKSTKHFSINTFCMISFILLNSLVVYENVFAQKYWNRDFTTVMYNAVENSISIRFKVFDYLSYPNYDSAYLKLCEFYFTDDGKYYNRLMRVETKDQYIREWTQLKMRFKKPGTELQFLGCFSPANASMWLDSNKNVNVEVRNDVVSQHPLKDNDSDVNGYKYVAFFTVKWFLGDKFTDVKRIRLHGVWHVNGLGDDEIDEVDYDKPSIRLLKSTINQSKCGRVKVTAKADDIVITGAENGEIVKVYNNVGVAVRSTVTRSDAVNIKLPKNQIYFVNVGQACYKVAM